MASLKKNSAASEAGSILAAFVLEQLMPLSASSKLKPQSDGQCRHQRRHARLWLPSDPPSNESPKHRVPYQPLLRQPDGLLLPQPILSPEGRVLGRVQPRDPIQSTPPLKRDRRKSP